MLEILREASGEVEASLLHLSSRVRALSTVATMDEWICEVLEQEHQLAASLNLPVEEGTRRALLTLLKTNSPLAQPLVRLLALRIAEFVATIPDLYAHPLRSTALSPLLNDFAGLRRLIEGYTEAYHHVKTVPRVYEALTTHRLHIYKSRPDETDLRVALRAFYEDPHNEDAQAAQGLLEFILAQLIQEQRRTGSIAQPRHAWWAVLTICEEADERWFEDQRVALSGVIRHLLSVVEHSPRVDRHFTSPVPELESKANEFAWVTINGLRILQHERRALLPTATVRSLQDAMEAHVRQAVPFNSPASIKDCQNRLILLYEGMSYYATQEGKALAKRRALHLRESVIGKLFYDPGLVNNWQKLRGSLRRFILERDAWSRPTLTAILVSGGPGQGKSELALQIAYELSQEAQAQGKRADIRQYAVGRELQTAEDLSRLLETLEDDAHEEVVRVAIIDEFDKADFDFYTPCLSFFETPASSRTPVTFFLFAQSSFATRKAFESSASSTLGLAARDFLTRLQGGSLDLPDIRLSPTQRVLTLLGLALRDYPDLSRVSRECVSFFALGHNLKSNRDIRTAYTNMTIVRAGDLYLLNPGVNNENDGGSTTQRWITVKL